MATSATVAAVFLNLIISTDSGAKFAPQLVASPRPEATKQVQAEECKAKAAEFNKATKDKSWVFECQPVKGNKGVFTLR